METAGRIVMKQHARFILDKLMKSYENSAYANPFKEDSGRVVRYDMKKYKKTYDVSDFGIREAVKEQLEELEKLGYIRITYDKEHRDIINYVDLNIENAATIYRDVYEKIPKSLVIFQIKELLENVEKQISIPWIKTCIRDELVYLVKHGRLHAYMGEEKQMVENLCKVFLYLDKGNLSYIRNMSVQLFHDSKYFENNLKNNFLSIVRKYEPAYLQAKEEEYKLEDNEIFRSLGFLMYPEVFSWKGEVKIYLRNGDVLDSSCYHKGFLLQADMLDEIQSLEVNEDSRIILVENKTTYYQYLNHCQGNEIVIFAGGHFSPERKKFYKLFKLNENPIYLWSDIDLGGFIMYYRLKREVFSELKPLHMDINTYNVYLHCAKIVSEEYKDKIKQHIDKQDMPEFKEILERIFECGKVLEQEAITFQTM